MAAGGKRDRLEHLGDVALERRLVVFDREQVVCLLLFDQPAGEILLGMQSIRRHDPAAQIQLRQQHRRGRDLVALLLDLLLAQRHSHAVQHRAEQVDLAALATTRAA